MHGGIYTHDGYCGLVPSGRSECFQERIEQQQQWECQMETQEAYRVAQTAVDARRAWLQERRTGIGGSDAPVVLGISPWSSRYELYQVKIGAIEPDSADEPWKELGRQLEPVVFRLLAMRTGRHVEAAEPFKLVRHHEHDWLFCTPDGWQWTSEFEKLLNRWDVNGIVQAKTAVSLNKHDWDQEPPDYYRVQLQHEMLASGCAWGTLAVLFIDQGVLTRIVNCALGFTDESRNEYDTLAKAINDHCDFRFFDYEADTEFQSALLEAERAFIDLIDTQTPPSTDGSESCRRAIQRLHPCDNGTEVMLPDEWLEHSARLSELKAAKAGTEKEIAELENALKAIIGDATYAVLPDGSRYSWKTQTRKAYSVPESITRVLRKERAK